MIRPATFVRASCAAVTLWAVPASVAAWVDDATYAEVADVAVRVGADRIKPVYDELGGSVDFEAIRVVLAHLRAA